MEIQPPCIWNSCSRCSFCGLRTKRTRSRPGPQALPVSDAPPRRPEEAAHGDEDGEEDEDHYGDEVFEDDFANVADDQAFHRAC